MHLIVIGVRYKTATLETIEKFSFRASEIPEILKRLTKIKAVQEVAILSTCNRSEIYATVSDVEHGYRYLIEAISAYKNMNKEDVKKYTFTLLYEDAIQHLFRVSSGLDSMVIGEYQIMSQIKAAYQMAYEAGTTGTLIDKLFKSAMKCGKRVRSEVGISSYITSISGAAIELAKSHLGKSLARKNIAIVGAGKMGQLAVLHLIKNANVKNLTVLNKSEDKLSVLRSKFPQVNTAPLTEYKRVFEQSDCVIVATSAENHLFYKEDLEDIGQTLIIDIAVPRNVHAHVKLIEGVTLLNNEHISLLMKEKAKAKELLIHQAHNIIYEELDDFIQWQTAREAVPVITELREKVENIRKHQVAKAYSALSKCNNSTPCSNVIEQITKSILNKILHDPTVLIKGSRTQEEIYQQAETLKKLFNLSDVKPDPSSIKEKTASLL